MRTCCSKRLVQSSAAPIGRRASGETLAAPARRILAGARRRRAALRAGFARSVLHTSPAWPRGLSDTGTAAHPARGVHAAAERRILHRVHNGGRPVYRQDGARYQSHLAGRERRSDRARHASHACILRLGPAARRRFSPGVFSADRLALHDRLAHTRVVRPSST